MQDPSYVRVRGADLGSAGVVSIFSLQLYSTVYDFQLVVNDNHAKQSAF